MDEALRQLLDYARGMWHRRWVGLAAAWIVALGGGYYAMKAPNEYQASARVYVDTASMLRPLMAGLAIQPNTEQQVVMLGRTLLSRPNVEKLMQLADLEVQARTPEEREKLIDSLQKSIRVSGASGDLRDNLYVITYRDETAAEAKRVVQSLVAMFVESSLGTNRRDTENARRFIEEQIRAYEEKLTEAENRLKEFRLRNMGIAGASQDHVSRVAATGEELARARMDLRAAEQSRDALKRELAAEEPTYVAETQQPGEPAPEPVESDARIANLRRQLDDLQRKFTEAHPDVVQTRRLIGELEVERAEALEARRQARAASGSGAPGTAGPRVTNTARNPVFQQLKVALADAEASVAGLRARVVELEGRYQRLSASAQLVPRVEAELAQLNRDYEVQKRSFDSLVQRRESAVLSGQMESTGSMAEFRVIDPPTVGSTPVAPNRVRLLLAALALAVGCGLFTSFLLSQLIPTVHDARTLREVARRPVLGVLSRVPDAVHERRQRRGHWFFAGGCTALAGAFAGLIITVLVSTHAF